MLELYIKLAVASIKNSIYNRIGFFLLICSSIIEMLPSMLMMVIIILRFGSVFAWSFGDYIFIFLFANFSYGFRNLFFGSFRNIPKMIVNGDLDNLLIRPINTLFYISGRNFNIHSISYIILSVSLFIIFNDNFNVDWSILNILLYLISIISAALVQGAITLIISCAAFFLMDSKGLDNLYSGFKEFIWYPLNIFNPVIQIILYTVVPLAYASFVPCGIFLRHNLYYQNIGQKLYILSLLIGPLLFLLSYILWKKSLRIYASSGN
jgi:ABC-2 type transport system permease protein